MPRKGEDKKTAAEADVSMAEMLAVFDASYTTAQMQGVLTTSYRSS